MKKYKRSQTPKKDRFLWACHKFQEICERIDQRCMAADGAVTRTLAEATDDELRLLYRLTKMILECGARERARKAGK